MDNNKSTDNDNENGKTIAKGEKPLHTFDPPLPENAVRQTWLQYFNNYLRDRHVITEEEWRKMRRLIDKN